jgi:hypothetical protein
MWHNLKMTHMSTSATTGGLGFKSETSSSTFESDVGKDERELCGTLPDCKQEGLDDVIPFEDNVFPSEGRVVSSSVATSTGLFFSGD